MDRSDIDRAAIDTIYGEAALRFDEGIEEDNAKEFASYVMGVTDLWQALTKVEKR